MAEPYIGEIRMFGGDFAPQGWAFCNGQLLSVAEHSTLFSLLGSSYGGDGRTTFAVPDLRGRVPVDQGQRPGGSNFSLGQKAGSESVTLTTATTPAHSHAMTASGDNADNSAPDGLLLANRAKLYQTSTPDTSLAAQAMAATGGSQSHDNMMPYLCVNFIIALDGIYPSRS